MKWQKNWKEKIRFLIKRIHIFLATLVCWGDVLMLKNIQGIHDMSVNVYLKESQLTDWNVHAHGR